METSSDPTAYTGIGSRSSPPAVLGLMGRIARSLALQGFVLRTGAASGADEAFITGALSAYPGGPGRKTVELYLPWPGFGGHRMESFLPTAASHAIAQHHHPAWDRLGHGERLLHARNVHVVLGRDLATPSAFVLCWTRDGATDKTTAATGGTGQALRVAHAYGVPVWNLARDDHQTAWLRWLADLGAGVPGRTI